MASKNDTPELILNAAEKLFAEYGYDGVSVRAITGEAGVPLNLLSYHFGTKAKVFETVITRRLDTLNQLREVSLAKLNLDMADARDVLGAFMYPYMKLASGGDSGWKSYALLIAKVCQSNQHLPILFGGMRDSMAAYIDALAKVLPDVPKNKITRGFLFTAALMSSTFSGVARIDALDGEPLSDRQIYESYEDLLNYTTAGFMALCSEYDVLAGFHRQGM